MPTYLKVYKAKDRSNSLISALSSAIQAGECLEWSGPRNSDGYGIFHINGKRERAHRAVYEEFVRRLKNDEVVCHSCDNPPCVNPKHLWAGTKKQNSEDMAKKGRAHKGPSVHSERHPLSKITTEIALSIRSDNRTAREISAQYGVSKSLVYGIKARTHWKYA